jgi:hypothetical protein
MLHAVRERLWNFLSSDMPPSIHWDAFNSLGPFSVATWLWKEGSHRAGFETSGMTVLGFEAKPY